jgi:hypothetical protein
MKILEREDIASCPFLGPGENATKTAKRTA